MVAVEPLVGIVASVIVFFVAMAAFVVAAITGHGPLRGRFPGIDRSADRSADRSESPGTATNVKTAGTNTDGTKTGGQWMGFGDGPERPATVQPAVRLLARDRSRRAGADAPGRRRMRPPDDELREVVQGGYALETYNRAIRVMVWSFILISVLVVSISQLWVAVQPAIYATIILAGVFVLVVHELVPPSNLRAGRIVLEGSAAIVFLTMLVMLTGNASSPFFFLYPLLVGGAALVAAPRVTLLLTIEAIAAYVVAAFSTPLNAADLRDSLARVAVNLTALVLLTYAGMIVARVQRRTREAAIRLSTVDSLTDLYNRAYFFNSVEHEIQRGRRFRRGFCLLMMDLDGLKTINDRYGHYQGDAVLRNVAQLIRTGLRGIDVIIGRQR